jgi:hypothetical protein
VDDRTSAGAIVKPGELTDVGRIALPGVGRIEGTVVYDDGTPVLDATIGSRYGQTVGRGGEFRQEFLSGKRSVVACCGPLGGDGLPSHYVIRDVRVRAGRTTRTKLVVPSQRGTVVEGQLTGIPGQRMTLVVFTSPDERWACASRVTNEGGFSVRPVPRGDAVLVFYAGYAGYGQPTSYFGYREMKIAGTPAKIAVDGLDVSTVRGTVSWPEGDAIAAIPVRLVPRPLFGRLLREGSQSPHGWFALSVFEDAHQSGTTDANGGFCFGNVGPGEYVLTAYPQGSPKFSTPVKVPGRGKTLMVEMRKPRR